MKGSIETSNLNFTVSAIQVINHQIVVTGTNLTAIKKFNIKEKEGENATELQIESQSETSLVANTLSSVSFAAGKVFDFILSNANADSTFTVNFSLCDSTLGTKGFNCSLVPNDRDVLSYDASTGKWAPRAVNGLAYQGLFDASGGVAPTSSNIGDYYIINTAGTIGSTAYAIGDWIVLSAVGDWEKINNSNVITSIFGRSGAIVATEGDYNLDKLSDVNLVVAPANGDVLKYDSATSKWIAGTVAGGGGGTVTSVTGSAPISVATGTTTPVVSISQATTVTNGYLSSTDWNTFNNKLSAASPTLTGTPAAPTAAANTNTTQVATTAFVMGQAGLLSPLAGSTSVTTLGTVTTGTWNGSTIAVANGGTGATTASAARTALGLGTAAVGTAGALSTNIPLLGTGGIVGSNLCGGDNAGGIVCTAMTSSIVADAVSDESGIGALLFGTSPTISNPVIANIAPTANFTLTQNAVVPFTSESVGAIVNTLYLKAGQVGIGTTTPGSALDIKGTLRLSGSTSGYVGFAPAATAGTTTYTLPTTGGTSGQVLSTDGAGAGATPTLSWVTPSGSGSDPQTPNAYSPTCPTGYVSVPAIAYYPGLSFCVMKYEAKTGSSAVAATTAAAGTPVVSINRTNARAACRLIGPGYDLISNAQWQTIARNIADQAANWSTGTAYSGELNRGHSDGAPFNSLAAVTDDNNPCSGTGQTCSSSTWDSQRRTHTLSNGEVIWDIGGNVVEWVSDNSVTSQGADGYVSTMSAGDKRQIRYGNDQFCASPSATPYCGMGYGYFNYVAGAVLRGGLWVSDVGAGVFAADLSAAPTIPLTLIGFRCVFVP